MPREDNERNASYQQSGFFTYCTLKIENGVCTLSTGIEDYCTTAISNRVEVDRRALIRLHGNILRRVGRGVSVKKAPDIRVRGRRASQRAWNLLDPGDTWRPDPPLPRKRGQKKDRGFKKGRLSLGMPVDKERSVLLKILANISWAIQKLSEPPSLPVALAA